eukprot:PhF_6_TR3351/c0_g1_i1/m.4748
MNVGYLTSSQYYGMLVHFFQTKESVSNIVQGFEANGSATDVPSQKRILGLVDNTHDVSKINDLSVLTNRCVMMSRIEVLKFEKDVDYRTIRTALNVATEYDVLAQGATLLDFVRVVGAIFSLNSRGPKMVLVSLSQYQPQLSREVYVVPAVAPVAPTAHDVAVLRDRVDSLLEDRTTSKQQHMAEMVSLHTQLEAQRRKTEDLEKLLSVTKHSSQKLEEDLKKEIFRLESLVGRTSAPPIMVPPHPATIVSPPSRTAEPQYVRLPFE